MPIAEQGLEGRIEVEPPVVAERELVQVAVSWALAPRYKGERVFAQLGRWRRPSQCIEGTEASARAWLKVASVGYLLGRL